MIAAIIGDIVGSRFEASGNKNPDTSLFQSGSTFTDDTVCTLAISQWLMEEEESLDPSSPGAYLRDWTRSHRERGFGANFLHWAVTDAAADQQSWGNGAAMRVSPVAFWAKEEAEALDLAKRSTAPTHLHPHSATGAQATVWAIRHAFAHQDPEKLLRDAQERWPYGNLVDRDPEAERATHEFDITVHGTVPLALVLAARGEDFSGTMRLACSMGGDADTLAAIAGPIAEGLYGLDEGMAEWAMRTQDLWFDPGIWPTLLAFFEHPRVRGFYERHGRDVPNVRAWFDDGPR